MDDKNKKLRSSVWRLLHLTAGPYFRRRFNYSCEPVEIEPPFLLISNHVTNSDPFFVGLSYKRAPLSFVASEHIFRKGFVSGVLKKLLAPIPRSKAASGAGTVKNVLRRIKEGEPVALFAEGDCTWSGLSAEVFPATGKLAKACGAPLVTYRIEGAYLYRPRWAKRSRRGKMHGGPVKVYSPEELKGMTHEEVAEAINRDIFFDVWEAQRKAPVAFRCKAPAEGLERALFICPECNGADCMASKGNRLFCKKCGKEWTVDEYGFINGPRFTTAAEWDEWQKNAVKAMRGTPIFRGRGVFTDLISGEKHKNAEFLLDADHGRMIIRPGSGGPKIKVLSRIDDMAMVKTDRLLFEDGEGYFEIKSKRGLLRPYLTLWQALQDEKEVLQ